MSAATLTPNIVLAKKDPYDRALQHTHRALTTPKTPHHVFKPGTKITPTLPSTASAVGGGDTFGRTAPTTEPEPKVKISASSPTRTFRLVSWFARELLVVGVFDKTDSKNLISTSETVVSSLFDTHPVWYLHVTLKLTLQP